MNTTAQITVVARWRPVSESYDEVVSMIDQLRVQSLAEPGCLGYEVFESTKAPRTLLLLEQYRDAEALEAHKVSAHYKALVVGRVLPLLVDRKVDVLRVVP